jgi:organic radical activating enzyme
MQRNLHKAMIMETKLLVSEIFYSLQGEGARAGTPTVFIRLTGCKAKNACYASGVKCDTEFESGGVMELDAIHQWIIKNAPGCKEITWTGGEPTDQLTVAIVGHFKTLGYYQAIETSGLNPCPGNIDFVCVSPKVAEHVIKKNFPDGVDEHRYVRHKGQHIPNPAITARHYWISPHSNGWEIDADNLKHCIHLCLVHPQWKLSVQQHKLWNIL